jgi:hypothetical protein
MLLDPMVSLIAGLEIKRRANTVTGCMDTGSDPNPDPNHVYKSFSKKHVVCLILCFPKNK